MLSCLSLRVYSTWFCWARFFVWWVQWSSRRFSVVLSLSPSTSLVWVTSRDHKTLSSWLKIFHLAWFFWLVLCQTSYMIVGRTVVWWIPPSLIKSWIFRGAWYTFIWICHTIRHGTFNAFRMFLFSLEIELISISNLLLLKMFIFPLWWVDQCLTEIDRGFVCFIPDVWRAFQEHVKNWIGCLSRKYIYWKQISLHVTAFFWYS